MIGKTMGFYLAVTFLRYTTGIFLLFLFLIIGVDMIEFSRRASSVEDVQASEILAVVLFRALSNAENVLPFTVMFGASATLIVLNRRLELVVARAAGLSVWQFLFPIALAAALVGALTSLVYNPVSIAALNLSSAEEAKIFVRGKKSNDGGSRGNWLRLNQKDGDVVIRAQIMQGTGNRLTQVIAYRYDFNGEMVERLDAASADFVESSSTGNHYLLSNVVSTKPGQKGERLEQSILPVEISQSQLQTNQTTAGSVDFWSLPEQARRIELAGKNALPFTTRYQSLLAEPLLFVAMVLLAATVSLRFARFGINAKAILTGILAGFVLYVIAKLLVTFGSNGLVPPVMAAWSAAVVASLICITVLLHQEDG
jgi:lipopolysaccharide export system permease protein